MANGWMLPTAAPFNPSRLPMVNYFLPVPRRQKKMLMLRSTLPGKLGEPGKMFPPIERADYLMKIADIIDENKEKLAMIESLDNGKPIRETMAIDVPYASDPFPLFRRCCPYRGRFRRDVG